MKTLFLLSLISITTPVMAKTPDAFISQLNNELEKINQLKAAANPGRLSDKEVIANENEKYLKALKNNYKKDEYEKIEKEIRFYQNAKADDINKLYLEKVKENHKEKINAKNQIVLDKIIKSSSAYLEKGFKAQAKLASLQTKNKKDFYAKAMNSNPLAPVETTNNNQNQKIKTLLPLNLNKQQDAITQARNPIQYETDKDRENLEKAIQYKNNSPEKYKSSKEDSIFEAITKTYIRNYDKLKKEKLPEE